jgi:hypothetical protein
MRRPAHRELVARDWPYQTTLASVNMDAPTVERLAAGILALRCRHPIRVGVDGFCAAGKTTLARAVGVEIEAGMRGVIRATTDDFQNPPEIRLQLLAGAFAVVAPRPAARPTLAFLKLLPGSTNATFSGHLLLGVVDPADKLVAGQRRDVVPRSERRGAWRRGDDEGPLARVR